MPFSSTTAKPATPVPSGPTTRPATSGPSPSRTGPTADGSSSPSVPSTTPYPGAEKRTSVGVPSGAGGSVTEKLPDASVRTGATPTCHGADTTQSATGAPEGSTTRPVTVRAFVGAGAPAGSSPAGDEGPASRPRRPPE